MKGLLQSYNMLNYKAMKGYTTKLQ